MSFGATTHPATCRLVRHFILRHVVELRQLVLPTIHRTTLCLIETTRHRLFT
jgi:hypothetical protein